MCGGVDWEEEKFETRGKQEGKGAKREEREREKEGKGRG